MCCDLSYFVIRVDDYEPAGIGQALSCRNGWFVGQRRFCGMDKARRFATQGDASSYLAARHGKQHRFTILPVMERIPYPGIHSASCEGCIYRALL